MWGWLPGRVLPGSLMGLGRLGVCPCGRAGQLTVSREACLSRVVGLPGDWCRRHARCGGLLRLLWSWWSAGGGCPRVLVCVLGVACCRGSGAVRPGCPARVGLCVVCPLPGVVGGALGVCCGCGWVGCELYSGREHLTVSLRQVFCRVLCCLFL